MLELDLDQLQMTKFHFFRIYLQSKKSLWSNIGLKMRERSLNSYPKGTDINPIENVWEEIVRSMDFKHTANANELWGSVYELLINWVDNKLIGKV
jgi:hypothetical protein